MLKEHIRSHGNLLSLSCRICNDRRVDDNEVPVQGPKGERRVDDNEVLVQGPKGEGFRRSGLP